VPIGIPKDTATGDLRTATIPPGSRASSVHIAHGASPEASHLQPTDWLDLDRPENHG
jgi:hypothetical protein